MVYKLTIDQLGLYNKEGEIMRRREGEGREEKSDYKVITS